MRDGKVETNMHIRATASKAASLLARNPSLFCRIALAKLNTARPMPPLPVARRINNILFEYDLEGYRGTPPMYFGSYALLVIDVMKRFLRPGDTFIDVGANIGYLSAIAAGLVGTSGQVHAFEPVPEYFRKLARLARNNPQYSIFANEVALGAEAGTSTIYITREQGQNTLVRSYKADSEIACTASIPVIRLDAYLHKKSLSRLSLIKIDAEGFEFPILKGLARYFETCTQRPAIICEIAPRAYALNGQTLGELDAYMAQRGYVARDLIDAATPVDICTIENVEDVLFLPMDGQ